MSAADVPKPRGGVEDFPCADAAELLDWLSPRHEIWNGDPLRWIFRGHADADWKLNPTAVREDQDEAFVLLGIERSHLGRPIDWFVRNGVVTQLLTWFQTGLDRAGFQIPTPIPMVGLEMPETWLSVLPQPKDFPLMALAQHHRIPTFFLDWTRSPRNAACFAAHDAATDKRICENASHLAVWALEKREFEGGGQFYFRYYEAPSFTNPNLRAQAGLFTLHFAMEGEDRSLDECLSAADRARTDLPRLRRFTLRIDEAPRLLKLLADEGVDAASMFPNPDGVVMAMRERALHVPSTE